MWHLARMKSCFSSSDRSLGRAWWLFVRRSVPPTRSPCLGSSNPFPPSDPVKREGASRFRGDSSRIHKWLIFDATVIMVGWYHPCQLHGNYIQYLVITYNGKASAKEHTHTHTHSQNVGSSFSVTPCEANFLANPTRYVTASLCSTPETNPMS